MSTHKRLDAILLTICALTLLLTVLFMNGEALGLRAVSAGSDALFSEADLDGSFPTDGATSVTLTGTGAVISGNGAYFSNGTLSIRYAGNYILSGALENGRVRIDADGDDIIRLLLNGASLHCEDGPALLIEQAGHVYLTLADGTENSLSDGAARQDSVLDGAIYSRDDLTVNGSGSLTVSGTFKHGVVCNDDLTVTGGTLTVDAARDAIHVHDSFRLCGASLTLTAGDDGITASNDAGDDFVYLASGDVRILSCYEGVEGTSVTVAGGTLDITPTDDGINAMERLEIQGGSIRIVNPTGRDADGLDSNGDIAISGGTLLISVGDGSTAIDYGSENGGVCRIDGGTVIACGSSAMLELPSADSAQAVLSCSVNGAAGDTLTLSRADGTLLLSETVPVGFSSAILSAPGLSDGEICTLTVGNRTQAVTAGLASAVQPGADRSFGGKPGFGRDPQPTGSEAPSGLQPPEGTDFPGGLQPPDGIELPEGMEPPEGTDFPGELQPPDGTELPEGMEPPEGMKMPEGAEPRGGLREPPQEDARRGTDGFRQDRSFPDENAAREKDSPGLSEDALCKLLLLGLSVLALLAALLFAVKLRH